MDPASTGIVGLLRRYGLALAVVAAAVLLQWELPGVLGATPSVTFYLAVVIASVLGGAGPGILATVLSGLCIGIMFDSTPGWKSLYQPSGLLRFGLFMAGGAAMSLAAGFMQRACRHARQQTQRLRVSEDRYRMEAAALQAIMDAVPGGICVAHDPLCRRITGNRPAHELLGVPLGGNISATPATGEGSAAAHFHMLHDGEELPPERLPMQMACTTGAAVHNEELEIVRRDGSRSFVLLNAAPLRDDSGAVRGVVAAFTDITARKHAEEMLRLHSGALEAAANGIAITDHEGTILWVNRAFCELTGYTREEAIGRTPRILKSGMQDQDFYRRMWETIRRGEVWHGELVNRRKDGSDYVEEMTISPLRNSRGEITHFIAVQQDVSPRRAEQQTLAVAKAVAEQAKHAAEEASRAKDQFLAVLSHELRTPLTPVVTALSMLQEGVGDEQNVRETLEMVRRNVEMEARLIDDLLDVTRIVRGKIELDRRPTPLVEIIHQAIEVCQQDIETRQIRFGLDIGSCGPCLIDGDPTRLQQVFWNLLKNAVKFTPHGGYIGICCHQEGESIIAKVTDSGEGIDPRLLPHIFNPFEQGGARVTRQFGGLGLGLTITKGVVELHGGTIEAHSAGKGKGATFTVRLPIYRAGETAAAPTGSAVIEGRGSAAATSPAPARKLRILLVEDHGDTAKTMRRLLSSRGYEVQTAGDVATALDQLEHEPFDLLLSDLGLPDGTGIELMRSVREHGRLLPGIALSGYGQEEDVRRSKEAGFAAHLTKPTNPDLLTRTIGTVIHAGRAQ